MGFRQDSLPAGVGYQDPIYTHQLSVSTTTSATYGDISGTSWTFIAPAAKTYLVIALVDIYFNPAGYGFIKLVINGNSSTPRVVDGETTVNNLMPLSILHAASCAAGSNTISIQWSRTTGTMATNTNCYCSYAVIG